MGCQLDNAENQTGNYRMGGGAGQSAKQVWTLEMSFALLYPPLGFGKYPFLWMNNSDAALCTGAVAVLSQLSAAHFLSPNKATGSQFLWWEQQDQMVPLGGSLLGVELWICVTATQRNAGDSGMCLCYGVLHLLMKDAWFSVKCTMFQ